MSGSAGDDCIANIEEVGELYSRHAVRVRRLVRLDVQASDAVIDEACQVAWMRLVLHWRRIQRDGAARWVARVARHEAYRQLRVATRAGSLESEGVRLGSAPDLMSELVERRVRLQSLRELPERQQRLVWLRGLGFSYAEMAGETGDSERTIERQLHRAQMALRRADAA